MIRLLQACGTSSWLSGNWGDCLWQPVTGLLGSGIFGLLLGAGIYSSLYFAAGGRATTATVVTILLASVLFPVLPAAYVGIAWTVLFVGGVAAIMQAAQKYVLSPTTMQ